MKTTLKDIAKATGYSISTVSRVLNGLDGISADTRELILRSANELNYTIQNSTNGMSVQKSLEILLVTGFDVGEFYASYFDGLNRAASNEKMRLSLFRLQENDQKVEEIVSKINEESFNAVILNIPMFRKMDYEKLIADLPKAFPIVSNCFIDNPKVDIVTFDNYGGAYQVANHFRKRKYDTLGIIKGPYGKLESRLRAHGFKDAIQLFESQKLIWEYDGDFSFEAGRYAFEEFEKLRDQPRAIFASNDSMCHSFIKNAQIQGYAFPEDIAIVGYDDLPICVQHHPTISSVHTPFEELGRACINLLKTILEYNTDKKLPIGKGTQSFIPVSVKIRESS